ncbi:MAG: shikimate kinase [Gemmatimonadaceae bacterium]
MACPSHLILIGLPGAGKSTVGRAVAERLGRPFIDLDTEIERREGRSVAELFATRGERYFRDRERLFTKELRGATGPLVLAPGGGWVTNHGVVALLRPPGRIIYLEVAPERALSRLGDAAQPVRPLLQRPDPLHALRELAERRRALYESSSDAVVRTDLLSVQQVTDVIVELASRAGAR